MSNNIDKLRESDVGYVLPQMKSTAVRNNPIAQGLFALLLIASTAIGVHQLEHKADNNTTVNTSEEKAYNACVSYGQSNYLDPHGGTSLGDIRDHCSSQTGYYPDGSGYWVGMSTGSVFVLISVLILGLLSALGTMVLAYFDERSSHDHLQKCWISACKENRELLMNNAALRSENEELLIRIRQPRKGRPDL